MVHPKRKREELSPEAQEPVRNASAVSSTAYQHFKLPSPSYIRILELQPGEGTSSLKCKLFSVERKYAPPYEAISYAWGRSTDTKVIYCDGKKLRVTVNLRDALWRVRDPAEWKLLWADAVCINQYDNEERADQVKQMGSIYADAARVLVWLDDHVAKLETADTDTEGLDPESSMIGHAFAQLLDSPWFSRLWVVQEVGLAKSVVVMFGHTRIDFVDLIRFILRLERRTVLIDRLGLVTAARANIFTTFPQRSMELAGEVDEDWDFLELMEVTRGQKASDQRDYVYALLGHPSALIGGELIVEPDYDMKTDSLFFDLAVKLIHSTNSLRVLSAVQHINDRELEEATRISWVPQWSRDFALTSLGASRGHYFDVSYDSSAGSMPIWELSASEKLLGVRGFVFDVIEDHVTTEEDDDQGFAVSKPVDMLISEASKLGSRFTLPPFDNMIEIGQTISVGYSNDKPKHFCSGFAAFRLHLMKEAQNQGRSVSIDLAPEGDSSIRQASEGVEIDGIYWATSRFCAGRKLFSTREGSLGLGPSVLKEGDLCCILFGAPVPLILRCAGKQYKLVGEAYVHGVMKGEAMVDWMLGECYQEQTFELR
ncbi:HET-domain-containing protein [Mollisia scopiformis]|uniref:HET-domain-containing protein n=1 Tax=Mollisia scopiformis TaxID=149040 RepID=A0A194X0I2_MOLSC|nr:HET-domain-containing protein [Mollisia scopiformis]KUJ13377.1 HET-domain-containing protein [Mollisia scopiformis]